jgi:photosystem II stability/assembly factor-like uncharacterized protein
MLCLIILIVRIKKETVWMKSGFFLYFFVTFFTLTSETMTKPTLYSLYFIAIIAMLAVLFIISKNQNTINKEVKFQKTRFDEPNEYTQYETDIRTKAGEDFPSYSANYKYKELSKAKLNKKSSTLSNIVFKSRGPYNVPGRTRTIVVDPDDPTKKTFFAGAISGGLWKTIDGGQNWIELTTDLPNLSISCVVISPSNTDVMYLGTGEATFAHFTPNGNGIFKSIDHGTTWELLNSTGHDSIRSIGRLVVDPENENIVLATTVSSNSMFYTNYRTQKTSAIIKTIDGGRNWKSVYNADVGHRDSMVQQIIADPNDFNILYVAQNANGVLKSTDKGETWKLLNSGLNFGFQRIELAIAQNNTSILYASVENFFNQNWAELYMSVDAGETWSYLEDESGVPKNWLGSQGFYNNTILVNPFDDYIVYVGGIELYKVTVDINEGSRKVSSYMTMEHITDYYDEVDGRNKNVHVDHHTLVPIINGDEFCLLGGNDGGVYITDYSNDPGFEEGSWKSIGLGYNTSQFYDADKKHGIDSYIGGTQDNGTWWSQDKDNPSDTTTYIPVIGGDGFDVVCHYDDSNKMIGCAQRNYLMRTIDNFETTQKATRGLTGTMPFLSKLANSKSDPDILFSVSSDGVFKSDDFGENWFLSNVELSRWGERYWKVEVSLCDPAIVWAGERMDVEYSPQVSSDGGLNFRIVNKFEYIGIITGIATHPTDLYTAYLLFSVDNEPKILVTNNLGASWRDISGFDPSSNSTGFPNVAVFSLLVMPFNTDILWAGTEIGIFESNDNGLTWHLLNQFPSVGVYQMKIVDNQVVIATYGRGIWTATIPELETYEIAEVIKPPRILNVYQDLFEPGIVAKVEIEVRDDLNYLYLIVNEENPVILPYIKEIGKYQFNVNLEEGENVIQLEAYLGARSYKSVPKKINACNHLNDPVSDLILSFDDPFDNENIGGDLFTAKRDVGFWTNQALHSEHDYEINTNKTTIIASPLIITGFSSKIKYKDVAIVQPAYNDAPFGDPYFYDYVVVEATKDSKNWMPIIEAYDARFSEDWLNVYESSRIAFDFMYEEHEIDLRKFFSIGDTIFVRFRLYSDDYNTDWGWVVNDFQFENLQVGVEDIREDVFHVFPNPAYNIVNINFGNEINGEHTLVIFDLTGKTVFQKLITRNSTLDISELQSGVYILSVKNLEYKYTKRLIIN